MGRLIDADVLREEVYSWGMNDYEPSDFTDAIDDAPTVEAIPKAEYENRLTTDMATIKQLSKSIKVLQKANSEIAGAYDKLKADYEARLKDDMAAMLKELQYDLYHALCHEIHGKGDCPCTNQTTSCLATFRVCDAERAIDKVIQQKINALKGEGGK